MDRRGFLQNLMIGAAALTLDPERLLWTPGKKTIFIPKAMVIPKVTISEYSDFITMSALLDKTDINRTKYQYYAYVVGKGVGWHRFDG